MQRKPVALYKPRGAAAKVLSTLAGEIAARLARPAENANTQEEAA